MLGDALDIAFQQRVVRSARRFDLPALIRLLTRNGYDRDAIYLESNPDASSGAALVEAVEFAAEAPGRVTILVNMGLLGSSSPLPSYFFRLIEQADDPQPFEDFIHFFDNILLRQLVAAVMPEEDHALWGPPGAIKTSYFGMLGPGSVATLAQVVAWSFPELQARVTRRGFNRESGAHACRTGLSRLDGSGVVGRHYRSEAEGFAVELYVEEERTSAGRSWPDLLRQRLQAQLLPLLAPARIPLSVTLEVLAHDGWVRLQPGGHLGFQRVFAREPGRHRMLIYAGVTGEGV